MERKLAEQSICQRLLAIHDGRRYLPSSGSNSGARTLPLGASIHFCDMLVAMDWSYDLPLLVSNIDSRLESQLYIRINQRFQSWSRLAF